MKKVGQVEILMIQNSLFNNLTTIFSPSQSIDIAISQKQLQYETSSLDHFPDVKKMVSNVLNELDAISLLDDLSNIKILSYPYQFVIQENNGITMVYSFAVLQGVKGEDLPDKMVLDPKTLQTVSEKYTIPENPPFIVLGKINQKNNVYLMASIAHEILHILIEYAENNQMLIENLSSMIPNNIENISPDESLAIIFEIKVLSGLFDGQEIMKYLIDRYIIDYEENSEISEGYIKDLRALVAVA